MILPYINMPFAQAVAGPSPVPTPHSSAPAGGGGGGGPGIDLGPLLDALKPENLFGNMLTVVGGQLEDAAAQLLDALWHSGVNVFTYTAPELTYAFPPIEQLMTATRVLVAGVTAIAVVLAAASLAGREVFGWGDNLGEHLGRIGLAATLANAAPLWVKLAIDWNNALCEAIGGTNLTLPGERDHQTFAIILLILALVWFGFRLGMRMLYRIGMLWILIPTAPIALSCWAIPQTQWVARLWTRLFVGWTFGQVLVTIALKLAYLTNPYGPGGASWSGTLFAVAMLALAYDAVSLLVGSGISDFSAARGAVRAGRWAASTFNGAMMAAAEQRRIAEEYAIPKEWQQASKRS